MASEAAEQLPSLSPDEEALELSTTVDPSYIIQLIRQLLPPVHMKELGRCPSANMLQGDLGMDGVCIEHSRKDDTAVTEVVLDGITDSQEKLSEQPEDKDSGFIDPSSNMDGCKGKSVQVQAEICENVNLVDLPAQRVISDIEGSHPSLNEDGPHLGGLNKPQLEVLPPKEAECAHMESTAGSQVSEEQREEAGCMLWDLAATQSHAEFMVENRILDVLLAILGVPHSDRIREICLGIMGNLACHAMPVKAIVQTSGLPKEIVQSLFVDDAPSLSEACRLLSASLHSEEVDSWVKAIDSRDVLERVMWITANTMNCLLLEKTMTFLLPSLLQRETGSFALAARRERKKNLAALLMLKSTELLLAMVDCQGDTASVLLSTLVHIGLPTVLTELLASEISEFNEGTCSHGNVVLDTILQIAEALSLADDVAGQLANNLKLFSLACQVIQLSAKDEVGPAGISATVLVANLLAEKEDLIHEVAHDVILIKQLLELLPSAGDDPGARNALWSILGRLSSAHSTARSKDSDVTTEVSLVFAHGCNVLLEDLEDHQDMEESEEAESTRGFTSKLETVDCILHVMEDWIATHDSHAKSDVYETIKSSCSILKGRLKEIELDANPKHDEKVISYQNGTTNFDG